MVTGEWCVQQNLSFWRKVRTAKLDSCWRKVRTSELDSCWRKVRTVELDSCWRKVRTLEPDSCWRKVRTAELDSVHSLPNIISMIISRAKKRDRQIVRIGQQCTKLPSDKQEGKIPFGKPQRV
jgi:hypothetical protein